MPKSHFMRMRVLGSAAVIGLFGSMAGTAQAVETQFGELNIQFDTTISMGASVRVADRDSAYLSEGNGGAVDPRGGVGDSNVVISEGPVASFAGPVGRMRWTDNPDNFDGSVNSDDARLNYDSGDLIGANIKANHDLVVQWRNYTAFVRAVGFYDVILSQADAGERSLIDDRAIGDVGRNYNLLDAFISADYNFAGMPLNIRVGKQVINWGESTFILGGNNVFNPIDVSAFRRPGSEIKEALLPVNAIEGSITLPEELLNISLSGYYGLDWEPFQLDPGGTPFAGSDVAAYGTSFGGNVNAVSFLSGSPFSGARRVCDLGAADGNTGLPVVYALGLLNNPTVAAAGKIDCLDSPFVNYKTPYTIGQHESVKLGLIDTLSSEGFTSVNQGVVTRDPDDLKHNDGDFGLSARYVAEWLGGTEFAAYYQNYTSRIPFASENARTMTVAVSAVGRTTQLGSAAAKLATPTGCLIDGSAGTFLDPRLKDPDGAGPLVAPSSHIGLTDNQNLLNPVSLGTAFAVTGVAGGPVVDPVYGLDNLYNASVLQCSLILFQSGISAVTGAPTLFDGSEILTYASDIGLTLEYPENIDVFGASFSTTLFGWGVQGDFTYRPEAPFQVDTDSVTIAAAMEECAFASVGDLMATFEALGTLPGHTCLSGGTAGNQYISGVLYNEMYTANVGTTATFTASDWWVDEVGADLGILVTEIGFVHVPGVEDTWLDNSSTIHNQYQNTGCQGSDLPLGGLLGLDHKSSEQCRPTDDSAGLVLLYTMQYNNAFGSGFVVAPTIVYSWDFYGTTPAPYGNFIEDRMAVNLGVTGTLNNNFKVGVNYTNFFGGHIQNKARDTDFASASMSYSF